MFKQTRLWKLHVFRKNIISINVPHYPGYCPCILRIRSPVCVYGYSTRSTF
ncbi:hypothetical protein Hanom_Chr03g00226811 [Helianthus anomalus]